MRLRSIVATSAAIACIGSLAPAAAQAKLPSPSTKRIVPGRSIGGVKIGMGAAAAVKRWGPGGSCAATIGPSCTWAGSMKQGQASFEVTDGRVTSIRLESGQKPTTYYPVYRGPITKWKTAKRIGIGSALRAVVKAYPKATPNGSGVELKTGKRRTLFESSLGRTKSITIVSG
jgi:hypothetical protein